MVAAGLGLDSLTAQAVKGGLLADRMAWVFVAGYQCALRHTFSELPADGIAVFAVSEDRKNDPPLPGVKSFTAMMACRSVAIKPGWPAAHPYPIW